MYESSSTITNSKYVSSPEAQIWEITTPINTQKNITEKDDKYTSIKPAQKTVETKALLNILILNKGVIK